MTINDITLLTDNKV